MRTLAIPTFLLLLALGESAIGQDVLRLSCTGSIDTTRDNATERTQGTVNLQIDVSAGFANIDGEWGCLADLGSPIDRPSKYACFGRQRFSVSDSEFRYSARSESDLFEGQSYLIINRYSGLMSVKSTGAARPAAQANWRVAVVSANFQCATQQRRF